MSKKFTKEEQKEKQKIRHKKWRDNNKEKISETNKKYIENNREVIKEKMRNYYFSNKEEINEKMRNNNFSNKEKISINKKKDINREKMRNYYYNNKEKYNINRKKNRENNPLFKLSCNMRTLINQSLKIKGYKKESHTHEILGCSFEELKHHLESQFADWMNWSNYGNPIDGLVESNKTWDIDHIIPLSSAKNEEELLKLNQYANLQPLCSYENRFVKRDN
jgi:hypothetical protein